MLAKLGFDLAGQLIGMFGSWGKAKQEAVEKRAEALQRSGTDELIAAVWFSPLVMAWFSEERAVAWIATVTANEDYFTLLMLITGAVFGLGKLVGRKS